VACVYRTIALAALLMAVGWLGGFADSSAPPMADGAAQIKASADMLVLVRFGGGMETISTSWEEGLIPTGFEVPLSDVVLDDAAREALFGTESELADLTYLVDPLLAEMLREDLAQWYTGQATARAIWIFFAVYGVVTVLDGQLIFDGVVVIAISADGLWLLRVWDLDLEPLLLGILCEDYGNCYWDWFKCKKSTTGACGTYWNALTGSYKDMVCEYHLCKGGCVCCAR